MKLYKLITFCCCLLLAVSVSGQIITTVAGNGLSGSTGDGGPATAARINGAVGGAFDRHGNYYVTDILGSRIRKVDAMGIITTVAGTGSSGYNGDNILATAAKLSAPTAVWVDSIDNIYIDDINNFRIRKIDAITGIITTIAGTGVAGNYGEGIPATDAQLGGVQDICMDKAGNLYLADQVNQSVRKIDNLGIITTFAGGSFSALGTGDGGPATNATFNYLFSVVADDTGNIYIADFNAAKVRMVNHLTHIITTVAGNGTYPYTIDGVPATTASMNPYRVTFNKTGNLTIADRASDRVYLIDNAGILHCVAGNGVAGYGGDSAAATSASIYDPAGIVYDTCGNLYIAETSGKRVRKVWFAGMAAPPVAAITIAPNDTICSGTAVTLTAAVSGADSIVSYQWYVNGILVTGATNVIYSYAPVNGDTVNCRVQSQIDCNGAFTITGNTIHIVTNTNGIPAILLSGVSTAAPGTTVTITGSVSGAGGSYLIRWMNHGAVFATTSVPSVSYVKAVGTDTITALIVPTGGCYDSVVAAGHIVTVDHTGISFASPAQLSIFPNPAHDVLHIIGVTTHIAYTLLHITGRQVMTGTLLPGDNELHTEALADGVYLLVVRNSNGERGVYRVVKE